MKKLVFIVLSLVLSLSSAAAFEGFSKESHTADGYKILLYQIDKEQYLDSFEFYVRLTSNNSEEYFTWCFDNLVDSMEHFKFLEGINVEKKFDSTDDALDFLVLLGSITMEQAKAQSKKVEHDIRIIDKRNDWRTYAHEAEVSNNGYINYWISKKFRLAKNSFYDWR